MKQIAFEEIVNPANIGAMAPQDINAITAMAEEYRLASANNDAIRRLVLAIDVQNDFMPNGALGVPGANKDVERMARFIYTNMDKITRIMCSMDTHSLQQIFHPCWWEDNDGNHPKPYTVITYDDVQKGVWKPLIAPMESLEYLKQLEQLRKKVLCVWPYHCIQGTPGAALEHEFGKMVYFHSAARASRPGIIAKGYVPYSEMYGIIKPEYTRDNFLNTLVLNAIEQYDEIFVMGEAASHCVLVSAKQIVEHFSNRPEVTSKITILEDCTSPIPGFEDSTRAAFEEISQQYGVKFAKSDIIL